MDKSSSRIPKLNFGFRKTSKTNTGASSEGNSPRGVYASKSGEAGARPVTNSNAVPGPNNTSTNLTRSKSLRVTRTAYNNLKHHSNSSVNRDGDEIVEEAVVTGGVQTQQRGLEVAKESDSAFLSRPHSKTVNNVARSSLRLITRSVSPRRALGLKGGQEEEETEEKQSPQPEVCRVCVWVLLMCVLYD